MVEIKDVTDGKVYCENCGTVHHQISAVVNGHEEYCVWCAEWLGLVEPEKADELIESTERWQRANVE